MTTIAKPAISALRCDTALSCSACTSTDRRASSMRRRSLLIARCRMSSWRHLTLHAMSAPWSTGFSILRRCERDLTDAPKGKATKGEPFPEYRARVRVS